MAKLEYVTLQLQKQYSSILHDGKDAAITVMIQSASAQVKNYLKDFSPYEGQRDSDDDYIVDSNYEPETELDSEGVHAIKPEIQQAVLLLVDMKLNAHRYGKLQDIPHGRLPPEVESILYPLRDPALK